MAYVNIGLLFGTLFLSVPSLMRFYNDIYEISCHTYIIYIYIILYIHIILYIIYIYIYIYINKYI